MPRMLPQRPPDFTRRRWTTLDVKKAGSLAGQGLSGFLWISSDLYVVERRRIELPTFALRTRRSPS